jgi:uncharacterized protein YqgC (DUF456 family)
MIDLLLLLVGIALIIIGIAGCILPIIPGPPISFAGVLVLHFTRYAHFGNNTLIILGAAAVIVTILDYMVPAWGTKKFGGSRAGMLGSIIGLLVGLFFVPPLGPFGIISILAGPFFGAYVGETIHGKNSNEALRAAFGSFIGFITGTIMKLVTSIVISFFFFRAIIQYFFYA